MKGKAFDIGNLLKKSFAHFDESNAKDMGAALSYFTIFSLVPLLSVLIILIGSVIGETRVLSYVVEALGGVAGYEAGELIRNTLIDDGSSEFSLVSSLIAGGTLLFGVIIITSQLQASLDRIFAHSTFNAGFWRSLRDRVGSFSIVIILAIFMMVFMIISTGVSFFEPYISGRLPYSDALINVINFLLSFLFIFGFSLINFRFLPHSMPPWKSVAIGSFVTSLLFIIAKLIINLYLYLNDPGSSFGAAGTILVILVWIYFSAQILFYGASVAYVHSNTADK